ncbi:endonuclease MutS2 [Paenibacillus polymyxa]|uniref:hypothetical protein n=1 Tax=Paenibacillus polymyxa TaxID=1406 RepID=UPI0008FAF042|nr:hypothetical protein [Paenibacillus polymyxa]APB76455.1 endonuclease MutS2 [Paenibacillus polymyxa]
MSQIINSGLSVNNDGLEQEINSLKDLITSLQGNVNFSLGLTWSILGVVVAALGVALFFMVRIWVHKRIDEELKRVDKEIERINEELDDRLIRVVKETPLDEYLKVKETHWISPTILNGWLSNGDFGFMIDELGFVNYRGIIYRGEIIIDGVTIHKLPQGFRPSTDLEFGVNTYSLDNQMHTARITVNAEDGQVKLFGCRDIHVIFNGIRFKADKSSQ